MALALTAEQDRSEPDAPPKGAAPERSCLVTRRTGAPDELIRFVLGPDHAVVPDLRRKLPGRGVWVGLSKTLVAQAVKKQLFSRGLKEKAVAAPDLPDLVDSLMLREALQGLALANKAGLVVTGFAKVEAAIAAGKVAALVHAAEGADDGKRKLRQALRRRFGDATPPEFNLISGEALDAALGRGNVVHVAVGAGPGAKVFLASARRLALYRGDGENDARDGGENLTRDEALEQDNESSGANGRDTNGLAGPANEISWDA
ncbi:RNA-binding protein [Rhodoblastus sp.]|uniref:RNA-binding protein n=1 Tax=Rhodoblastus sp. TaxID=1962975 RepID=UPI00261F6599|nr:RNA-binding protein [Rhodoblastus sp.]